MAFKYSIITRYSELDERTIQLLEQIDAFEYNLLKPKYNTLGELHNSLKIEVDRSLNNDYKFIEKRTIADIKAQIYELEKKEKVIDEYNNKIREEMRRTQNRDLETQMKRFPQFLELRHLKEVLKNNSDYPDSHIVDIEWRHQRRGYYKRHNENAKIVLEKNIGYLIAETYIHEMMHAFYDSERLNESPNIIEYVEEPLAEYGMLHFLSAFVQVYPQHKDILEHAIKEVNSKQYSFGLYHYAFGEYIYQNYSLNKRGEPLLWEKLLLDAKNKVDVNSPEYTSLQAIFQARPKKTNQDKAAQLLHDILTKAIGLPVEKIAKQKRTKTTKRTKITQQQSKQPLNIAEETYTRWLKRYQEEGILPSEEEMDEAMGSPSTPSATSKSTGPSKVIVEYQEPYDSFVARYKIHLEYDYNKDELQYWIKDPLRGCTKTLSDDEIRTIKSYLKNRQNIENFFKKSYDTEPIRMSHILYHTLSMEYGNRKKKVENGELMSWAEPFAKLC